MSFSDSLGLGFSAEGLEGFPLYRAARAFTEAARDIASGDCRGGSSYAACSGEAAEREAADARILALAAYGALTLALLPRPRILSPAQEEDAIQAQEALAAGISGDGSQDGCYEEATYRLAASEHNGSEAAREAAQDAYHATRSLWLEAQEDGTSHALRQAAEIALDTLRPFALEGGLAGFSPPADADAAGAFKLALQAGFTPGYLLALLAQEAARFNSDTGNGSRYLEAGLAYRATT